MRNKILIAVALFGLTAAGTAQAYTQLKRDCTATGCEQGDIVQAIQNIMDAVNEMVTDHGTNKTTVDESRTAIIELIDDHDSNQTMLQEISDDLASYKTIVDELKSDFNLLRTDVIDFASVFDNSTEFVQFQSVGPLLDATAIAASSPDALTSTSSGALAAGDPTASAAAITNSTSLTLSGGQ